MGQYLSLNLWLSSANTNKDGTSAYAPTTMPPPAVTSQVTGDPKKGGEDSTSQNPVQNKSPEKEPETVISTQEDDVQSVEKLWVEVNCAGKKWEVGIFPLEMISTLKQNACDHFDKKACAMQLIYKGEKMREDERVRFYNLRRGTSINLIHNA